MVASVWFVCTSAPRKGGGFGDPRFLGSRNIVSGLTTSSRPLARQPKKDRYHIWFTHKLPSFPLTAPTIERFAQGQGRRQDHRSLDRNSPKIAVQSETRVRLFHQQNISFDNERRYCVEERNFYFFKRTSCSTRKKTTHKTNFESYTSLHSVFSAEY